MRKRSRPPVRWRPSVDLLDGRLLLSQLPGLSPPGPAPIMSTASTPPPAGSPVGSPDAVRPQWRPAGPTFGDTSPANHNSAAPLGPAGDPDVQSASPRSGQPTFDGSRGLGNTPNNSKTNTAGSTTTTATGSTNAGCTTTSQSSSTTTASSSSGATITSVESQPGSTGTHNSENPITQPTAIDQDLGASPPPAIGGQPSAVFAASASAPPGADHAEVGPDFGFQNPTPFLARTVIAPAGENNGGGPGPSQFARPGGISTPAVTNLKTTADTTSIPTETDLIALFVPGIVTLPGSYAGEASSSSDAHAAVSSAFDVRTASGLASFGFSMIASPSQPLDDPPTSAVPSDTLSGRADIGREGGNTSRTAAKHAAFKAPVLRGSGLIAELMPFDRAALDESLSRFIAMLRDDAAPAESAPIPIPCSIVFVTAAIALEGTRRWQRRLAAVGSREQWKHGSPSLHGLS